MFTSGKYEVMRVFVARIQRTSLTAFDERTGHVFPLHLLPLFDLTERFLQRPDH
jgi:hypothetical protein